MEKGRDSNALLLLKGSVVCITKRMVIIKEGGGDVTNEINHPPDLLDGECVKSHNNVINEQMQCRKERLNV